MLLPFVLLSRIKEGGRLTEKPYHEPHGNSTFDNETKVWVATNVPKAVPDKREDVHHLENWLTERSVRVVPVHVVV